MPIYEYRCSECHQVFEEWVKHAENETARHACPICKGAAKRMISNTSFSLKGTGWYATEYGSHKIRDPEKSEPGATGCAGKETPSEASACSSGCSVAKCPAQSAQ
jgi:putative FmdB family regulatory protein